MIATTSELMSTGVDAKTCKLVVLDQNIQSMTKFKQIIGRGTRIDDRYNKLWFTILDFKKATELFADEAFDGPPEKIMVTSSEDERFIKFHVSGVTVNKIAERVQYYDTDGKLVTESFKDYTRNTVLKQFESLDDFVKSWNDADRKQTIIDELASHGVIWEALEQDVSKDMGPFDLICHVVYDQPALTRKERADKVKKRNYFTKYNEAVQNVLHKLLDKYADIGISEIESKDALKVTPFKELGRPSEIAKNIFGGNAQYKQAIKDLENALYDDAQASA